MSNKDKDFIDLKMHSNYVKLYKTVVAQLGHDQYTAIGDLTDNCVDAKADKIDITLYERKGGLVDKIMIRDNGTGMTRGVIASCQAFANDNPHDDDDCGFFGVGGTSASMFLGKRKTVISKTSEDILKSVLAPFESNDDDGRLAWYEGVSEEDADILREYQTGTAIIIEELNTFSVNKAGSYFSNLHDYLAETFRIRVASIDIKLRVIDQKGCIKSNKQHGEFNKYIQGHDPLFRSKPGLHVIAQREFNFPIELPDGEISNVKLSLVGLSKEKFKAETGKKLTYTNSGVHVLRNNRQIIAGGEIPGIYTNHPTTTGLRFEISYQSEVEQTSHIKVNTQKSNIHLSESLIDRMKELVAPFRRNYIPEIDKQRLGSKRAKQELIDQIETIEKTMKKMPGALGISHKKKNPTGDGPYRQSPHSPGSGPKNSSPDGRTRKKREIDLPFTISLKGYEKVDTPFWLEAPTLESEDKYVIVLNTETRFYQDRFMNLDSTSRETFLFLLYALNTSLTMRVDDHNFKALEQFVNDTADKLELFVATLS
jgi:hypothetical protein